jgi:hypothetical protein
MKLAKILNHVKKIIIHLQNIMILLLYIQTTSSTHKLCHANAPFFCQHLAMHFDPLYLMQCFSGEITFHTMRTSDNGDIFDNEQIRPFAKTARHISYDGPDFSTHIADHGQTLNNGIST